MQTANSTPSNAAANSTTVGSARLIGVSRSSVDFFAQAAPQLHAYVRRLQEENAQLRAQNGTLRQDAEILDGISEFLREMSKSDLNYAQFMAVKTAEVEQAKRKQPPTTTATAAAAPAASASASASKDLPPVKAKAATPFAAAIGAAAPPSAHFGAAKPAAPAPAAAAGSTKAPKSSKSPIPPSERDPRHTAALEARPKRSQKRAPPVPAGEGARYVFTPADAATHTPPLRHVVPYEHEYRVFVKQRWIGRTVIDVLVSDFAVPGAAAGEGGAAGDEEEEGEEEDDAPSEASPVVTAVGASSSDVDAHARAYYRAALAAGQIRINGRVVAGDSLLRSGDHLTHRTHRHEPPVLDCDPTHHRVEIIEETDDVLAVNKPCGLPVHECGKLRHNTLLGLLHQQLAPNDDAAASASPSSSKSPLAAPSLFPVHRLDKVTSGVVLLGKTKEAAARIGRAMKFVERKGDPKVNQPQQREVSKLYLARVSGRFPTDAPSPSLSAAPSSSASASTSIPGVVVPRGLTRSCHSVHSYAHGWLHLDAPIRTVSLRKGVHEVDFETTNTNDDDRPPATATASASDGKGTDEAEEEEEASGDGLTKRAATLFRFLSYDAASDTSVVECRPLTGRTHQLRLHLRHLGHPICNDPVYGPGAFQGNTYGVGPPPSEVVAAAREHREKSDSANACRECEMHAYYSATADAAGAPATAKDGSSGEQPLRYTTGIFLHALAYTIPLASASPAASAASASSDPSGPASTTTKEFRTPLPDWARADFDVARAMGEKVRTTRRAAETLAIEAAAAAATAMTAASSKGTAVVSTPSAAVASSSSASSPPAAGGRRLAFHLRPSISSDLPSITAIYRYWVLHGTGTFEEVPPTHEEMATRRADVLTRGLPFLVATTQDEPTAGGPPPAESGPDAAAAAVSDVPPLVRDASGAYIVGYAYLSPFRTRTAYRWSIEDSIYLHPLFCTRTGLGRKLVQALVLISEQCGFTQLLAVIGDSANARSIGLHASLGFTHAGVMAGVGFKFNRWLDVVLMQRRLNGGAEQLPPTEAGKDAPTRFDAAAFLERQRAIEAEEAKQQQQLVDTPASPTPSATMDLADRS